jgi:hypothetical protein
MEETLGNETTGRWKRHPKRSIVFVLWVLGSLTMLMLVTSVIGSVAYSALRSAAFLAKAKADVRTLACAIDIYKAHMGTLPATLAPLTAQATNGLNQVAGPFMGSIPRTPPGFSKYEYVRDTDGRWSIFTSGRDFWGRAQRVEASAGSLQPSNRFCHWGGQRPSLADYVRGRGLRRGATAAAGA